MDCMQLILWTCRTGEALFQYRKRYGLHAIGKDFCCYGEYWCFNTASGMDCMQSSVIGWLPTRRWVSIPQAVWIACNLWSMPMGVMISMRFQYRKRYGLHAIIKDVNEPEEVPSFQYRKRYGLHAIYRIQWVLVGLICFNTASGMDCMQSSGCASESRTLRRFNTASGMDCMQSGSFGAVKSSGDGFNTASGMDCMQYEKVSFEHGYFSGFNTASGMDCMQWYNVISPALGFYSFNTASGMDCMQ